jgi:hypothetical protein
VAIHCIGITMRWVLLPKPLLTTPPAAGKMQFSPHQVYASFHVARAMSLLKIHPSFHPSLVLLLVAFSGITSAQPMMFPTLKTCKTTAAGAFLSCASFETGSKLPEFSGIMVSARAGQYSTKPPSCFRSLILNSRCSSQGRQVFSAQ